MHKLRRPDLLPLNHHNSNEYDDANRHKSESTRRKLAASIMKRTALNTDEYAALRFATNTCADKDSVVRPLHPAVVAHTPRLLKARVRRDFFSFADRNVADEL